VAPLHASRRYPLRMKSRDLTDLLLLAAIWGASYLFLRLAVPAFGPVALIEVRVAVAAAVLLPLLAWRGSLAELRAHALPLLLVGTFNSAMPFVLLAYGLLHITTGVAAILNAMVPLWAALIGWAWLRDRLGWMQWLGLLLGVLGVVVLVWGRVSLKPGSAAFEATIAIAACLAGTVCYGLAAVLAKRLLTGVSAWATAAGSQVGATLVLLPFAVLSWPAQMPGAMPWAAALALGVLCTAIAYLLYFRLIRRVGPVQASSVTFLLPVTASLWGVLLLGETVTAQMLGGGAIILAGTALSLGLVGPARRNAPATVG
jgi:drug/metabolite transporter (DMT)-like permease